MEGTSGLQGCNLCEVPISLFLLPDCLHPLGCPTHGGGYSSERQAVPRAFRDAFIFILASHEPSFLWPRCASIGCFGIFWALVSPSLHSSLERKLLVNSFKIPIRPLVRDD